MVIRLSVDNFTAYGLGIRNGMRHRHRGVVAAVTFDSGFQRHFD